MQRVEQGLHWQQKNAMKVETVTLLNFYVNVY